MFRPRIIVLIVPPATPVSLRHSNSDIMFYLEHACTSVMAQASGSNALCGLRHSEMDTISETSAKLFVKKERKQPLQHYGEGKAYPVILIVALCADPLWLCGAVRGPADYGRQVILHPRAASG